MKKQFSLFRLFLSHWAWRVLAVLTAMAAAQIGLFLAFSPDDFSANSLHTCLAACRTPLAIVLLVGFALTAGLLLDDRSKGGQRLGYTLDRLALSPRQVITCQAAANLLAWILFWAAEVLVLFVICRLYEAQGGYVGPQTLYLTTWQSPFFHSFLPMDEVSRWGRNLILILCLSVAGACSSAQLRRKRKGPAFYGLVGGTVPVFINPMGYWQTDLLLSLLYLGVTAVSVYNAAQLGKEDGTYEAPELE